MGEIIQTPQLDAGLANATMLQAVIAACAAFLLPLGLGPARPPCRLAVEMTLVPEEPLDLSKLRSRIEKIQSEGLSTPAQMLFELATEKAPGDVMREFFTTASPQVTEAMQDAVMSLLGSLPPLQFDASMTTTGDRLAALMLQLQMTGYMLRNAEYVFTLRRLLDIKSRSIDEYRAAFDRIDTDGSGYIEPPEVEKLLADVYDGEAPGYEASTFLSFFDVDNDGKISWEEFAEALGASEESSPADLVRAALPSVEDAGKTPKVSGVVTVQLESGNTVEMDAEKYMDELKKEARSLAQTPCLAWSLAPNPNPDPQPLPRPNPTPNFTPHPHFNPSAPTLVPSRLRACATNLPRWASLQRAARRQSRPPSPRTSPPSPRSRSSSSQMASRRTWCAPSHRAPTLPPPRPRFHPPSLLPRPPACAAPYRPPTA